MIDPLVSIVIPTHNRKDMLVRLIKSILKSTYTRIEILIIDDASTDGTAQTVRRLYKADKRICVVRQEINKFTAGSRNEGIRRATGSYIFFIDDDNILHPDAVKEMVDVFQQDKTIGELGPVNYGYPDKKAILWLKTERNMWTTKTNQPRQFSEDMVDVWDTADVPNAFMVRTSILKKESIHFREAYGIMYEESDFAYRIRAAGYKICVVKKAHIYHDIERIASDGTKQNYMYHFMADIRRPYVFGRNRVLFHSVYSTPVQQIGIYLVWVWVFTAYYSQLILLYDGVGDFSLMHRIRLVIEYLRGTCSGIYTYGLMKKNS
jgi:GT2 family glycosyltransferase